MVILRKKIILTIILLLSVSFNTTASTFYFKFNYGIGMVSSDNSICFYQLVDRSGRISEKIPLNISDGITVPIKFKKKKVKKVIFSGYYLDDKDSKRSSFLRISKLVNTLYSGSKKSNVILVMATTQGEDDFTPVAELIRILSNKDYSKLLDKKSDELFGYNNTFPIGRFILYNPKSKKSKDVLKMPSKYPPFIQNSRSVYDHYVLRKGLNLEFSAGYQMLNVSTQVDKQQFIEYKVKIDTLQMINWVSEESEMKFLFDNVNKGTLDFLKKDIEEIADWKLYFVNSCVKIKNFSIISNVFDSLGVSSGFNIEIPIQTSGLRVMAGVVYGSFEGVLNAEKTFVYYTGFKVRDYTKNIRNYFAQRSLDEKMNIAENEMIKINKEVKDLFEDFRKVDESILDFSTTDMIVRFFEMVKPKTFNKIIDSLSLEEKEILLNKNSQITSYNIALEVLKEKIIEYKNARNFFDELGIEKIKGNSNMEKTIQPKEIKINDEIIEAIIKI